MLFFTTLIIILVSVSIAFYYLTVVITLVTDEFKSKKDLVFSFIPYHMWYTHIKTMYNRLP